MSRAPVILFFCTLAMLSMDQYVQAQHLAPSIEFIENKGQWEEKIQFESSIPGGQLYIESGKMSFVFYKGEDMDRLHELKHNVKGLAGEQDLIVNGHLFQVSFLGSNKMRFSGGKKKNNYYNYFLGNDERHWAGKVPAYREVVASNVWDGIDYRLYSQNIDLKYDFIVKPYADVTALKLQFEHLDKLYLKNGNLYLKTSVNELIDLQPLAYQKIDGKYVNVKCHYTLKRGVLSFEFPDEYDKSIELIIDPKLIFSSFTGSTKDNWGFTATFDQAGNLYGGGIVLFGNSTTSYPTTTGAFQTNFGGGGIDMGISKFSSDGLNMIYSTYLGGSLNEIPHSLVVNSQNQLVVMGTTSSPNYPTTSNAYDNTYNISGSASITVGQIFTYIGSDVVLSKFSAGGDSLLGSTFIGGSSFDGVNNGSLEFNYGDDVRGEVVVDNADNILVATTTHSTDFPITNFSTFGGGLQDAVVFKMNSSLSGLMWSAYLGGSGIDAAYSVQVDNVGRVYAAGGTTSNNFPTTSGVIHPANLGGTDGFVAVLNPTGFGIIASTRLGTTSYDQAYFVQLDDSNRVFVTGQTEGQYQITPSTVYSNPNSGQFIHKLTNGLDSTIFSTVVGTGGPASNITIDISPSAFLVNQCDHIYLSGWGGTINNYGQPNSSTTNGLPTTNGAYKTTTDGNDFYLIVLDKNADSLLYATFFGGTAANSGEHVDGGTSRFDKRGIVYQAVCAGCGGNSSFPTSPSNVWSSTNGSNNCNLGVIKFDLSQLSSDVALNALPKVCVPGSVAFQNNSNGGTNFFWDFGDGDTSTLFQPVHTYLDTGNFTVMLIVSDSLSCLLTDTSYIVIRGDGPPIANIDPVPVICPGDSIQLNAHGGIVYKWSPNSFISNDTISNPFVSPLSNTTYVVVVGDSCGSDTSNYFAYDTATVSVIIAQDGSSISGNDTICKGDSIQLSAGGGVSYNWTPSSYLNNSNIPNPISSPPSTTGYSVVVTDQYGCPWEQNVTIYVEDPKNPSLLASPDTVICKGDSVSLFVIGGSKYLWRPGHLTRDSTSSRTYVFPDETLDFYIDVINKCFVITDTVHVDVIDYNVRAMPDTFACEDVPIQLFASPGIDFEWTPTDRLINPESNTPRAIIKEEQMFYVQGTDEFGCTSDDSLFISLRNAPYINAGGDRVIQGNAVELEVKGNGSFVWEPKEYIKCPTCKSTEALVIGSGQLFRVKITDEFGCVNSDQVLITKITHGLYVPNTFSPNSDQKNETFRAYGFNIDEFELKIYNRWGELLFVSQDIEYGWNGNYDGHPVQSGTYVWTIKYKSGEEETEKKGSVTLLK